MAFSNTTDTANPGSAVSNFEGLRDVLTILAPKDTPATSMANKGRATATFTEWTVDTLAAPDSSGIDEGADVTAFVDKFANRARLGNFTQHLRRTYKVSGLQQAVDSVGPAKIAQAKIKAMKELKRDIELTLLSNNDRQQESGTGSPYKMRGFENWISSTGPSDVPSDYRTPADSIIAGSFTEQLFLDQIASMYIVTGEIASLTLIADTALRRVISDFRRTSSEGTSSVRRINYDGGSRDMNVAVNMYDSDHGMVSIVNANPVCMPDTVFHDRGFLLNMDYYEIAELISMSAVELDDQGGGPRGYCDWTGTLCVKHPGAHGKIDLQLS